MKVTLPYPPSVNRYWRRSKFGMYLSKEARDYKEKVKQLVPEQTPTSDRVEAIVKVFRPRRRGDLDNVMKAVFDSLKGLLYVDDSQIYRILAILDDDKVNPRVEVEINALG